MKRELLFSVLLLWGAAQAQTRVDLKSQGKSPDFSQSGSTFPAQTGATLPASCSLGELFYLTGSSQGFHLHACTEPNTWTPIPAQALSPEDSPAFRSLRTGSSEASRIGITGGACPATPEVTAGGSTYVYDAVLCLDSDGRLKKRTASELVVLEPGSGVVPLPLAGGGTNQTAWTAGKCVQVSADGTRLEAATDACGTGSGGGAYVKEWVAAACQSSSASLGMNTASSTSPVPDCAIGAAGAIYGVAKFSNTVIQELQGSVDLPATATTIHFDLSWRALSASGDVVWQIRYVLAAQDDTGSDDPDLAAGTVAAASAKTAIAGRMLHSSIALTPANPGGKRLYFKVFRDPNHASDTFTHATNMPELAKVRVSIP